MQYYEQNKMFNPSVPSIVPKTVIETHSTHGHVPNNQHGHDILLIKPTSIVNVLIIYCFPVLWQVRAPPDVDTNETSFNGKQLAAWMFESGINVSSIDILGRFWVRQCTCDIYTSSCVTSRKSTAQHAPKTNFCCIRNIPGSGPTVPSQ
jgi:hypothetical protein